DDAVAFDVGAARVAHNVHGRTVPDGLKTLVNNLLGRRDLVAKLVGRRIDLNRTGERDRKKTQEKGANEHAVTSSPSPTSRCTSFRSRSAAGGSPSQRRLRQRPLAGRNVVLIAPHVDRSRRSIRPCGSRTSRQARRGRLRG